MDDNQILKQFDQIEQKIEYLIKRCRELEFEKAKYIDEIERLEKELQIKIGIENQNIEENKLIRSKVNSLVARLDEAINEKSE